jgi:hypothetical protein
MIMVNGRTLFGVALAISSALANNVKSNLTSAGLTAVFPGQNGYAAASAACVAFLNLFLQHYPSLDASF